MAGGFGYKDGSYIVQAVGDYARYKERQKDKAYERERQEQMDRETREARQYQRERQNMLDERSGELHELDLKKRKMSIDDIKRQEKERNDSRSRRQAYADALLGKGVQGQTIGGQTIEGEATDVTPPVQPKAPVHERIAPTVGKGASGTGVGIETTEDATTGDILLSITKEDGKSVPMTADPYDNNSKQLRVRADDANTMEAHVERSADQADKFGLEGAAHAAYIRASTTADGEGYLRPATESEFMANLKQQGLLKAITGEKVLPNKKPEAKAAATEDEGFRGLVPMLEDMGKTRKTVGNLFKRVLEWEGNNIKKGATWIAFGDKGLAQLTKNDEVKVKAVKSITTPKGIEEVVKAKETIDKSVAESGAEPPKRSPQVQAVAEVEETLRAEGASEPEVQAARMQNVRENNPRFEKQAAVVSEMFIHGDIGLSELHNFQETGDIRYSQLDLEKQRVQLDTQRSVNKARVLEQQKGILSKSVEMQKAVNKANAEAKKKGVETVKAHREVLQEIGANAVDEFIGSSAYQGSRKSKDIAVTKNALVAKLNRLSEQLLATDTYGDELYISPGGRVQLNEAIKAYLMENGSNSDITVESLTPYMTMVEGRYKVATSKVIAKGSKIAQLPMNDVRQMYKEEYERFYQRFKRGEVLGPDGKPAEWNEGAQEMFDTLFLDELLKSQGR